MNVLTDWLDVTYAPDDVPEPEVRLLLLSAGFGVEYDKGRRLVYTPPKGGRGAVVVTYATRYGKISFSGGACEALRATGIWPEMLFALGSSPHKVTRLDCALDLAVDAADVIDQLTERYPLGSVALGRKFLSVTKMLETRADGRESGTYYIGHRTAARATGRVYDKRLEVLKRTGVDIGHHLTRFEMTARKDYGATLRDAYEPAALFWHIASPALLNKPAGVPVWSSGGDLTGWDFEPRERVPYEVLTQRVEWSAEIEALALLADSIGVHGRSLLLSMIKRKLGLDLDVSEGAA